MTRKKPQNKTPAAVGEKQKLGDKTLMILSYDLFIVRL